MRLVLNVTAARRRLDTAVFTAAWLAPASFLVAVARSMAVFSVAFEPAA